MGPLNDSMKKPVDRAAGRHQVRHRLDDARRVPRSSRRGASRRTSPRSSAPPPCASTSSATRDVQPTAEELEQMRDLVRQAMEEGALGVGSVAHLRAGVLRQDRRADRARRARPRRYGGMYISHMRSEGNRLLEAVDETDRRSRARPGAPAEIYHLKAAGQANWRKLDAVIAMVEAARRQGVRDHRRHVHLHRRRHRPRRRDAALGAGRRPRGVDRAAAATRPSARA